MMFNHNNNSIYTKKGKGFQTLEILEFESQKYNKWISNLIKPYLGNINLEIGSGIGSITKFILAEYKTILVESSKDAREILENRFKNNKNLISIYQDLSDVQLQNQIDCIFSSNVLEHIENDLCIIEQSFGLLINNGYFVSFVPGGGNFLYSELDFQLGHYRRYSFKDLRRIQEYLSKKYKFMIIKYKYLNPISAIGWFLKMKILKVKSISKNDIQIFEKLLPMQEILNQFPLPFGQNIFFVIRKLI